MGMLSWVISGLRDYRQRRWWRHLRNRGMILGKDVNLPYSTWIDESHCFLISIGNNCGFGEGCVILAHDAMPNEYIDSTRIGKIKIHESCHFGTRTIILPGVEIGPRSIVGAGSVVNKDIPSNSVAIGSPAEVICSMDDYLNSQKRKMEISPVFDYNTHSMQFITPQRRKDMLDKLDKSVGFIVGGYTAMTEGKKCLHRTK